MDTEDCELGPFTPVPDLMILAAVERAALHGIPGVWIVVVGEHLGFARTAHNTRRLRLELERLAGPRNRCVDRSESFGREYWTLTPAGRGWLERNRGEVGRLPEAPQHRQWRLARNEAGRRMNGFRDLLYDALQDAGTMAVDTEVAPSRVWFELSERLHAAFWLLGSAIHCRDEWLEPSDARLDADEDPGPLPGRRAISTWDEKEAIARRGSQVNDKGHRAGGERP